MSRFPTARHLVASTGLCPDQNESAGRREASRLRKGVPCLKTMLVQCAWSAKNQKDSYSKPQFHRLKTKRGPQKVTCAIAASLLITIYYRLKDGTLDQDLGPGSFDQHPAEIKTKRLIAQPARLG